MKTIFTIAFLAISLTNTSFAQKGKLLKYPFVSQTEFGVLFGRTKNTNYYYPSYSSYWPNPTPSGFSLQNIANLSLQTFNGFQVRKKTSLGLTTGIDMYSSALIIPLTIGVRHVLYEKNKQGAKLQAGLDAGYGSAIGNSTNYDYKGGTLVNPSVGFKFPTKNGSSWLVNFGYKYQYMQISQNIDPNDTYTISSKETRNLKRFQVRLGFEF